MRLRLNFNGKDLAYRFKVHESTISRTFEFVICLLYAKLKSLILWPNRDVLKKTMPMVFRKHCPSCVVIIDCFEIFVDRPTNLLARAQAYSQYKHHNTVKYLIGITPQGTVSYISEGWGGRTSDKFITEHSSLLSNLVPGDTILADRGFDITDSVGFYCAAVKTPAFTSGRNQLSGIEVEQTRRIANIRIHVERVIGNIRKKYSILSATQPIQFLMSSDESKCFLDKIVHVCCALIKVTGYLRLPYIIYLRVLLILRNKFMSNSQSRACITIYARTQFFCQAFFGGHQPLHWLPVPTCESSRKRKLSIAAEL